MSTSRTTCGRPTGLRTVTRTRCAKRIRAAHHAIDWPERFTARSRRVLPARGSERDPPRTLRRPAPVSYSGECTETLAADVDAGFRANGSRDASARHTRVRQSRGSTVRARGAPPPLRAYETFTSLQPSGRQKRKIRLSGFSTKTNSLSPY